MECGIDPGREKIGFAFTEEKRLLFSGIVPMGVLPLFVQVLQEEDWLFLEPWGKEGNLQELASRRIERILLGDGTASSLIRASLSRFEREGLLEVVKESFSTQEGRRLYWELHPPKGLWRLVPTTLRVPPRPIDDLAAWALLLGDWKRKGRD